MNEYIILEDLPNALDNSLHHDNDFVKLTLNGYYGMEEGLKSVHARSVIIKRERKFSLTYRYKTKDIVKNVDYSSAVWHVRKLLPDFNNGILYTTQSDLIFDKKKGVRIAKASYPEGLPMQHDRVKKRLVETQGKHYLHALGITDDKGQVLKTAQDKYRQIDKYIEIMSGLIASLPADKALKIADMGAGKGYLTFALYDYLVSKSGRNVLVEGVEYRQELVDLCNKIAENSGFKDLRFTQGAIKDYNSTGTNILIALHACDTATDEALFKGIEAEAKLIVVAPCCHKQIRQEMEKSKHPNDLDFLMKHGTFMERQAEMVTDGMRAQLLEYCGYTTKIFEFISDSHTPKNVMIVATRTGKKNPVALEAFLHAKSYFGIRRHALEGMLNI